LSRMGERTDPPPHPSRPHLVDELLDSVRGRHKGQKVVGVGHSLGGFLK
jgi:surfactin synthase thioesterase subunit